MCNSNVITKFDTVVCCNSCPARVWVRARVYFVFSSGWKSSSSGPGVLIMYYFLCVVLVVFSPSFSVSLPMFLFTPVTLDVFPGWRLPHLLLVSRN